MARLEWKNVAAPSFAGISDNYRTMSDLLDRAASSTKGMFDIFANAQQNAADRAIIQRMMGVQDAGAYDPVSIIGADGARASLGTLRDVADRPGVLLDWASRRGQESRAQDTHGFTMELNNRTRQGWERLDAARQSMLHYQNLMYTDPNAAQQFLQSDPALNNLTPEERGWLFDSGAAFSSRGRSEQALADRALVDGVRQKNFYSSYSDQDFANLNYEAGQGMTPQQFALLNPQRPSVDPLASIDPLDADLSGSSWASSVGLVGSESGGNYQASNDAVGSGGKRGHFGALQFGHDRLEDAKRAGVIPQDMTAEQFRTSGKEVQDRVADWHFQDIDNQVRSRGLDRFFGQTIGGVLINRDSVRAMAHLGGIGGVQRFIETGGRYNPADANGTRLSDYGRRFGQGASAAPTDINPATGAPNFITPYQTEAQQAEQLLARAIENAGPVPQTVAAFDRSRAGTQANANVLNQQLARMEDNMVDPQGRRYRDISPREVAEGLREMFPEATVEGILKEVKKVSQEAGVNYAQAGHIIANGNVTLRKPTNSIGWWFGLRGYDTEDFVEIGRTYRNSALATVQQNAVRDEEDRIQEFQLKIQLPAVLNEIQQVQALLHASGGNHPRAQQRLEQLIQIRNRLLQSRLSRDEDNSRRQETTGTNLREAAAQRQARAEQEARARYLRTPQGQAEVAARIAQAAQQYPVRDW